MTPDHPATPERASPLPRIDDVGWPGVPLHTLSGGGGGAFCGGPGRAESPRLLTTAEAAAHLGTSPRTLEDWRLRGGGPVFRKVGSRLVRYAPTDLDAFIAEGARVNTGGGRP